jgi:hypothetical protein
MGLCHLCVEPILASKKFEIVDNWGFNTPRIVASAQLIVPILFMARGKNHIKLLFNKLELELSL